MATPGGPSISNARIAVIGAGGIGCAVLPRIARMRIAGLSIFDGDRIEQRNLENQPLYDLMDIGRFKAGTAAGWMRQILVSGDVQGHDVFLDSSNAGELLRDHDVIVEGVDDLHAKDLIDRTCGALGIPLVSGGVHAREGQVIVLHAPYERHELSRRDLFSTRAGAQQDGCDMRDVPPGLLEEVGRMMAAHVHDLLHRHPAVNGRIELFAHGHWTAVDPAPA